MDKDNQDALLKRIKQGHFQLFDHFIQEFQNPLYVFLYNIVKNENDARDLCQETFFKAYKSLGSFKRKAKFSTWLFQIGYYQALNLLRKRKKQANTIKNLAPRDEADTQGRGFEVREMSRKVDQIMDGLSIKQRTALFLFYKEEREYKEIAAIMNAPLNTVKSYIFRGKEEIRRRLNQDYDYGMELQTN